MYINRAILNLNFMKMERNRGGITPTADFIANQHTGKFIEILPRTYMIKGAKNDRGFDQAYAISDTRNKEFILIDVVQEATREAVETIVKDGNKIRAILITGKGVLDEAYDGLSTLSQDAGGAQIYLHPDIALSGELETKSLLDGDSLLSDYNIQTEVLPALKNGSVLIYINLNGGMLFPGDAAKGSGYETDNFLFSRDKAEKDDNEFKLADFWQKYPKDFSYFFPRQGKPAIEIDERTRTTLLDRLGRGGS